MGVSDQLIVNTTVEPVRGQIQRSTMSLQHFAEWKKICEKIMWKNLMRKIKAAAYWLDQFLIVLFIWKKSRKRQLLYGSFMSFQYCC